MSHRAHVNASRISIVLPAFRLAFCATSVALLTLPLSSQSQTPPAASAGNEATLKTVTVVGNWLEAPNEEKVLEHPGARTIIAREAIAETGANNVRDVLRQVPGVQVRDNNGTGGSDISLNVGVRGLTSRLSPRSTILMDGVPVAVAPYGQPQLSMAPLSLGNLEAVDVVRGAGSVRYGPQNVGGIISFVTRAIPKTFAADASVSTDIYSYGSSIKANPTAFIGGTNDNGLGGALLYSGVHGSGYRENNDNVDIDDLMLKGAYRISKTDELSAAFHYYDAHAGMPGGLTPQQFADDPFQSTRPYDSFSGRRSDYSFKYAHNDNNRNFEVLMYYTSSFRGSALEQPRRNTTPQRLRLTTSPRNYHVFAIEPRYSQLFRTGSISNEISVGYRYLREGSEEKATRTAFYAPGSVYAPDLPAPVYQWRTGGTTANAFYVDDTINVGNWTITPGLRYEFIRTNLTDHFTGVRRDVSADEPLPSLSMLYHLSDKWTAFANAGVSFGPLQYFQIASTTNGLKPEKAKTYEIGTHFDGVNGWGGELTLFNIDFDDELQLQGGRGGALDAWTNLGATTHRGVESGLRFDFGSLTNTLAGLTAYATYTFTDATYQQGAFAGRDLPFYSRHVATLGMRYVRNRWAFNVDGFAQSKQRSPGNPAQSTVYQTQESSDGALGDIPGYALMNVRVGYDFGKTAQNLKLVLGIKNVFDRRYYTRSNDNNLGMYVGMPRTVYLQASLAY
ncbi:ferric citrate outer membrane transporter; KpLE2 phage-like element (plasmid) [Cupriavidus metallidurans CH34]|uniref:Ferric citrate outer membrane transporter KpLE2 phage-like element n=2 Tax=Cupriavidus metallidurans TaxID=119219 RepID=Q1LB11_CUPMC|nr:ferric citrate outer membrane transporter; KpLE2 phage-like element [Cupriavidus metallidurans CH34]